MTVTFDIARTFDIAVCIDEITFARYVVRIISARRWSRYSVLIEWHLHLGNWRRWVIEKRLLLWVRWTRLDVQIWFQIYSDVGCRRICGWIRCFRRSWGRLRFTDFSESTALQEFHLVLIRFSGHFISHRGQIIEKVANFIISLRCEMICEGFVISWYSETFVESQLAHLFPADIVEWSENSVNVRRQFPWWRIG